MQTAPTSGLSPAISGKRELPPGCPRSPRVKARSKISRGKAFYNLGRPVFFEVLVDVTPAGAGALIAKKAIASQGSENHSRAQAQYISSPLIGSSVGAPWRAAAKSPYTSR